MGEIVAIIASITVAILLAVISFGLVLYYVNQMNALKQEVASLKGSGFVYKGEVANDPSQPYSDDDAEFLKLIKHNLEGSSTEQAEEGRKR